MSPTEPCSTSSPEYITATRSVTRLMTPRLWLMNRMVTPDSRFSSSMRSSIPASTVTSRLVVGSSITRSAGFVSRAIAITTR